jgi:hypothetical protein
VRRGTVRVQFKAGATIGAPPSGVHLGAGQAGPISVRLFRSSGTRIALACPVAPAQLIAIRTAAAGAAVHVVTARGQQWEPLLRHGPETHVLTPGAPLPPYTGPTLLIDDRPTDARGTGEVLPWHCRLDVRTHWTPPELASFAHADIVVFGTIPRELVGNVASAFGLPTSATEPLSALATGYYALLRRGRLEYVSLDPTPAESQVLALAA